MVNHLKISMRDGFTLQRRPSLSEITMMDTISLAQYEADLS
jgi:hypothetical protein